MRWALAVLLLLAALVPLSRSATGCTYTVRSGDNLTEIAARYNITLTALLNLNPQINNPNLIFVGQTVHVPCPPCDAPNALTIACNACRTSACLGGGATNINCQNGNGLTLTVSLTSATDCGAFTRSWTSQCGQSCSQRITVTPLPPAISCPAPATIPCGGVVAAPTTSDLCGSAVTVTTITALTGACGVVETVSYRATNACGLTAVCSQSVTVLAATVPATDTTVAAFVSSTTTPAPVTAPPATVTSVPPAGGGGISSTTAVTGGGGGGGTTVPATTAAPGGSTLAPTTAPAPVPASGMCCGDPALGAVLRNGASCVPPTCVCPADPSMADGTTVFISGGAGRAPSVPVIRVTSGTPVTLRGTLVVVINNAPVAGRYVLLEGSYTGRLAAVELRFQTNQRATFTCFTSNVAFEPNLVAADVTVPTDNCAGGGMPWWIWVVVGVGVALLLVILIVVIVLLRRRHQRRLHHEAAADGNIAFSARNSMSPYSPFEDIPHQLEDDTVNFTTGGTKLERPQQGDLGFQFAHVQDEFGLDVQQNQRLMRRPTQTNNMDSYTASIN